jgi:hypothetical protein
MKVLNESVEEPDKTINSPSEITAQKTSPKAAGGEERGEGGFFLTGVNVGNKEVEDYQMENVNSDQEDEELALATQPDNGHLCAEHVDRLKLVAVVDSARTFSSNDVSKDNYVNLFSVSSLTKSMVKSPTWLSTKRQLFSSMSLSPLMTK